MSARESYVVPTEGSTTGGMTVDEMLQELDEGTELSQMLQQPGLESQATAAADTRELPLDGPTNPAVMHGAGLQTRRRAPTTGASYQRGGSYGANEEAYEMFCELDADISGGLQSDELLELTHRMGLDLSRKQIKRIFCDLATDQNGEHEVLFDRFAAWYNNTREHSRRSVVRQVRETFNAFDSDSSGKLNKQQFGRLADKLSANNLLKLPRAPFDLDADWKRLEGSWKKPLAHKEGEDSSEFRLGFSDFERWWKARLGIQDSNIPVIPEYMAQKIEDASMFGVDGKRRQRPMELKRAGRDDLSGKQQRMRNGKELWEELKPRVLALVKMQRQWGELHKIYDSSSTSRLQHQDLPPTIRDPDSRFSAVWDLTQVILLLYVTVTVPLRAGFEIDVALWSFGFFIDALIDLYFVTDICLNFRTAYYHEDGAREERPQKIAERYLRGWFCIDVASTLPVGYIAYLDGSGGGAVVESALNTTAESVVEEAASGNNVRAIKVLRLVRLSKMLRITRERTLAHTRAYVHSGWYVKAIAEYALYMRAGMKKILLKYGDNPHLSTYISVSFTLFSIVFVVHLMTCFFYMIVRPPLPPSHPRPASAVWVGRY